MESILNSSVSDYLSEARRAHESLRYLFENELQISGHPISYWKKSFHLSVRSDMDLSPAVCKELQANLLTLNQNASFYYTEAQARLASVQSTYNRSYEEKMEQVVSRLRGEQSRLPAATIIENLAKAELKELLSVVSLLEMEVKFWKDILSNLDYCRKILEGASFNNNIEMRLINNQ